MLDLRLVAQFEDADKVDSFQVVDNLDPYVNSYFKYIVFLFRLARDFPDAVDLDLAAEMDQYRQFPSHLHFQSIMPLLWRIGESTALKLFLELMAIDGLKYASVQSIRHQCVHLIFFARLRTYVMLKGFLAGSPRHTQILQQVRTKLVFFFSCSFLFCFFSFLFLFFFLFCFF